MLPVSTVGKDDGSGSFIAPAPVSGIGLSQNTEFVSDDATTTTTKKVRKPYTIKKTRESWSEQEHEKFIESLQLYVFFYFLFCFYLFILVLNLGFISSILSRSCFFRNWGLLFFFFFFFQEPPI